MSDFDIVRDVCIVIGTIFVIIFMIIIMFELDSINSKLDITSNCITYNGVSYCRGDSNE